MDAKAGEGQRDEFVGGGRLERFSSRHERLSHVYLKDRLQGALEYLRIAGYFRSSIFDLVNEEIESIGNVRVICNADLDPQDINAAKQAREQLLKERWNEVDDSVESFLRRPRYKRLYEILKKGNVEIRVVSRADAPFLHGKAGVIRRPDGSATSFMGSLNETREGWSENYELVWEDILGRRRRLGRGGVRISLGDRQAASRRHHRRDRAQRSARRGPTGGVGGAGRGARRAGGKQPLSWRRATDAMAAGLRRPVPASPRRLREGAAAARGRGRRRQDAFPRRQRAGLRPDGRRPGADLCPATLTTQWQMELKDKLNIPSAVWLSSEKAWQLDPDELPLPSVGAEGITKCPRQIAIVSTGLIVHMTEERRLLRRRNSAC